MCSGLHARYTDVDVGMVIVFTVVGVAVDSPVYEPLVGAMDTSGRRVSNLDTDLKGT